MKKYIFILLLSCIVPTAFAQNLNISNGTVFEGEPFVAVNPTNSKQVNIAWMGFVLGKGITIKLKHSEDGGTTWGNTQLMPHYASGFGSADVSMAYNEKGELYICYIDYRKNPDSGGIYVIKSSDGGKTFDNGVKAFDLYDNNDKPIDRPWLAVDRSGKTNNLYIVTKPAPWDPIPNKPYIKVSQDGGKTWSAIKALDSSGDYTAGNIPAPMAFPAVNQNGTAYFVYPAWKNAITKPSFILTKTINGAATLNRSIMFSEDGGSNGDTLSKLGYSLYINPADSNNMILLRAYRKWGDLDVAVHYNTDGGSNWSAAQRVNDDSTSNNKDQDLIWGAFNETGQFIACWRDRRNSAGTGYENDYDIYYAMSSDGGKTFAKNIRISVQKIAYAKVLAGDGNDFMGAGFTHDTIHVAWGDTRSGKLNIYYYRGSVTTSIGVQQSLNTDEIPFYIFPNPTEEIIHLKTPNPERVYKVYDINGKYIQSINNNNLSQDLNLNISNYPAGYYIITGEKSSVRFLKK